MEHETVRGRLLYTSKKPEIMDKVRGGETFVITKHIDESRTLRAHCAIDENSPRVLRDSITSVDANWHPTDGFVRLTVDEKFIGSSWYRFTPNGAALQDQLAGLPAQIACAAGLTLDEFRHLHDLLGRFRANVT